VVLLYVPTSVMWWWQVDGGVDLFHVSGGVWWWQCMCLVRMFIYRCESSELLAMAILG